MSIKKTDRLLDRFAYIETELFWGDGLTAGHLARTFSITRQMAQKIIDQYRSRQPKQMCYDAPRKRHKATDTFRPVFIRTSPHAFLDYLRGQALVGLFRDEQEWSELAVTDVDRLLRPELPLDPVRVVLTGLRNQIAVLVDYRKKELEPGSISTRVISPNHLVYTGGRYHVRAYCHMKQNYLDFVLSRIAHAEIVSIDWVSADYDKEWNEFAELRLKPNELLPASVQASLLRDYGKKSCGIWTIKCRKALLYYVRRQLLSEDSKYGMPLWCFIADESQQSERDCT